METLAELHANTSDLQDIWKVSFVLFMYCLTITIDFIGIKTNAYTDVMLCSLAYSSHDHNVINYQDENKMAAANKIKPKNCV